MASQQLTCSCCRTVSASPVPHLKEKRLARRTRGAASWALPSVGLVLLPKCPMCIAAWLAIGSGFSIPLATAAHLRTGFLWLCWTVLALAAVRLLARFAISGPR